MKYKFTILWYNSDVLVSDSYLLSFRRKLCRNFSKLACIAKNLERENKKARTNSFVLNFEDISDTFDFNGPT